MQTYRYNHTVNIQQAVMQDRYDTAQTWSVCNKRITQFYLRPTHKPFVVCPPSHKASLPFGGTHCTYSRRDGQAAMTWVAGYIPRYMSCM